MSTITNFILTFSVGMDESGCVEKLNAYIREKSNSPLWDNAFVRVDQNYKGRKVITNEIWVASTDNLGCDEEEIIAKFLELQWSDPESVQLFVNSQNDDCFRSLTITLS